MGRSATATLFYGIPLGSDEDDLPWKKYDEEKDEYDEEDPDKWLRRGQGLACDDGDWKAYYERKRALEGVEGPLPDLVCGGVDEYGYYGLSLASTSTDWAMDAVGAFMEEQDTMALRLKLRTFCRRAGLEFQEPRWLLSASYG
jgi:hypothetical protein